MNKPNWLEEVFINSQESFKNSKDWRKENGLRYSINKENSIESSSKRCRTSVIKEKTA